MTETHTHQKVPCLAALTLFDPLDPAIRIIEGRRQEHHLQSFSEYADVTAKYEVVIKGIK